MDILITGANRGIGRELSKIALEAGHRVFAASRQPCLLKPNDRLRNLRLDVNSEADFSEAKAELAGQGIDILIANAGVMFDNKGAYVPGQKSGAIDFDAWAKTMETNVLGVARTIEAFLPNVLKSERKVIGAVSSLMGSISSAGGGYYMYRSSKAALNCYLANLAIDLKDKGVTVLALHPGWLKTDMGGENAPLEVEVGARGLFNVLASAGPKQAGSFIQYNGERLPW